jgi:hypothetical protein
MGHLTDLEAQHRAEATEKLIEDMRGGRGRAYGSGTYGSGTYGGSAWWDHPYAQLAHRTPTEALADGDEAAVRALIDEWYAASERSAEELRNDPEAMARIEAQLDKIHSRRTA